LSCHDTFDFTAMPIFCCATIVLFSPRCHLLLHLDIFVFTTLPSLVAPLPYLSSLTLREVAFLASWPNFSMQHLTFLHETNFPTCSASRAQDVQGGRGEDARYNFTTELSFCYERLLAMQPFLT
jgi:hypothetical protein